MKKKVFIVLVVLSALMMSSCLAYKDTCATYEGRKTVGQYSNHKSITYNHKK